MGIIAKSSTAKRVADMAVPFELPMGESSLLDGPDLLYLNAIAVLARIGRLTCSTEWSGRQGKSTSTARAITSSPSILRLEALPRKGFRLHLGSAGPTADFKADWTLRAAYDAGGVALTVPSWRTLDDGLVNRNVLEDVRALVLQRLAQPVKPHFARGVPDFAEWVVPQVAPNHSPMQGDFVAEPPACFAHSAQIAFDPSCVDDLYQAFQKVGAVPAPQGTLAATPASSGLAGARNYVVLCANSEVGWIQLYLPDFAQLSLIGRQRVFRSVLFTLRDLRKALPDSSPAKAELEGYTKDCLAPMTGPDRMAHLIPLPETKSSPMPLAPFAGQAWLPVGIVVTTRATSTLDDVLKAERSLLVRQRVRESGFTKAGRDKSRRFASRRPALLETQNGGVAPYLRYVTMADSDLNSFYRVEASLMWFWEVAFRRPKHEGSNRYFLFADGLATCDGALAYGVELFTLFREWANVLAEKDPSAEIVTVFAPL